MARLPGTPETTVGSLRLLSARANADPTSVDSREIWGGENTRRDARPHSGQSNLEGAVPIGRRVSNEPQSEQEYS
jgi:hypothetical protein